MSGPGVDFLQPCPHLAEGLPLPALQHWGSAHLLPLLPQFWESLPSIPLTALAFFAPGPGMMLQHPSLAWGASGGLEWPGSRAAGQVPR